MTRISLLCMAAVLFQECSKQSDKETPVSLLSQVKQKLADRDAKISSYHLKGSKTEQGLESSYEFFFRSPNRMQVAMTAPVQRTASFDGKNVFDLISDQKQLFVYELKLPPEKAALFLAQTFSDYAPEGFRAPRFVADKTTARQTSLAIAPEAIELLTEASDDNGKTIQITYILRWPALDFLSKETSIDGSKSLLRVDKEHCDDELHLCFPKVLTLWKDKDLFSRTTLTDVEINHALPVDQFTLVAPDGYKTDFHELTGAAN